MKWHLTEGAFDAIALHVAPLDSCLRSRSCSRPEVHRIVNVHAEGTEPGGELALLTKGDNNQVRGRDPLRLEARSQWVA